VREVGIPTLSNRLQTGIKFLQINCNNLLHGFTTSIMKYSSGCQVNLQKFNTSLETIRQNRGANFTAVFLPHNSLTYTAQMIT